MDTGYREAVAAALALMGARPERRGLLPVSEPLRLGRSELRYADPAHGVLTQLKIGGCYFAAPFGEEGARELFGRIPAGVLVSIAGAGYAPLLEPDVEPSCYDLWVYEGAGPVDGGAAKISIRTLDTADLDAIERRYHMLDHEVIVDHLERGWVHGGFNGAGELVGFIGEHTEASMGMLEIFPEHRRRGYARALEAALANKIISEGRVPYGHVAPGNVASRALQERLGLTIARPRYCWIKRPA